MGDAVVGQSLIWGNMTNYAQLPRARERNQPQHSPGAPKTVTTKESVWRRIKQLFDQKERKTLHGYVQQH
jgi:hypothetical protein